MNEERYILARFIQILLDEDEKYKKEKGYEHIDKSWDLSDLLKILEKIRIEAVLGEETAPEELPFPGNPDDDEPDPTDDDFPEKYVYHGEQEVE